jgi:hypothetical protein
MENVKMSLIRNRIDIFSSCRRQGFIQRAGAVAIGV